MISTTAVMGYVVIAAGIAAIIKILISASGRVTLPGFSASWGK